MDIATTISIYAGGPGSGCQGANCGRPITGKSFKMMRRRLKQQGLKLKKNLSPWDIVKTFDTWKRSEKLRQQAKKTQQKQEQKAKGKLAKAEKKGKLGQKISKKEPRIDLQPVWKGNVKHQYTSAQGHQITELNSPRQYEKNKGTWVLKPSPYKGQFLVDLAEQKTHNDPKERNSFFIHQEAPDKGVSVEVHRNFGKLAVNVIERKLGQYGAIESHREVSFKNVGRAAGFLNKRYGITFKLK